MPTFVSPRGKGYAPLEKLVCPSCQQVKSDYVKMGMSNDYKVAIDEGATIIRIGTKIFGEEKKEQYN